MPRPIPAPRRHAGSSGLVGPAYGTAAISDRRFPDLLVVLSPHLGILDSWLPILVELRRQQPSIHLAAVLPTRGLGAQFRAGDLVTEIVSTLFGSILCAQDDGTWSTLEGLAVHGALAPPESRRIDLGQTCADVGGVLFDITEERKGYIQRIVQATPNAIWHSLPHGVDLRTGRHGAHTDRITLGTERRIRQPLAYVSAESEVDSYQESFRLDRNRIKVVGIPRHSRDWVDYVARRGADTRPARYIFLASRPANDRIFPRALKVEALRDVLRLAEELDCGLVIRRHPRETDLGLFREAIGDETPNGRWRFSTDHPLALGSRAFFCVTLFSSVAVDMAAMGVPVIEHFDFHPLERSAAFVPDGEGGQTSIYRRLGLVLGASNFEELRRQAQTVAANREAIGARLRCAYGTHYASVDDPVGIIVKDIQRALAEPEYWARATGPAKWDHRGRIKEAALQKVEEGIAALRELGFAYEVVPRSGEGHGQCVGDEGDDAGLAPKSGNVDRSNV